MTPLAAQSRPPTGGRDAAAAPAFRPFAALAKSRGLRMGKWRDKPAVYNLGLSDRFLLFSVSFKYLVTRSVVRDMCSRDNLISASVS